MHRSASNLNLKVINILRF